jgi:hypothetical protein
MKKILISLVFVLIFSCPTFANNWTKQDTYNQTALLILQIIDYRQTSISPEFEETNPLLGKHPTQKQIDKYFMSLAVGTYAVSYILPKKFRGYWQYLQIISEAYCIGSNYSIGIRW